MNFAKSSSLNKTMFSQYRDIPSINIPTTCDPKIIGNVVGDGNCCRHRYLYQLFKLKTITESSEKLLLENFT